MTAFAVPSQHWVWWSSALQEMAEHSWEVVNEFLLLCLLHAASALPVKQSLSQPTSFHTSNSLPHRHQAGGGGRARESRVELSCLSVLTHNSYPYLTSKWSLNSLWITIQMHNKGSENIDTNSYSHLHKKQKKWYHSNLYSLWNVFHPPDTIYFTNLWLMFNLLTSDQFCLIERNCKFIKLQTQN